MSVTFAGGISFLIAIIILGFIYYDVSKDYGQAARDMWCLDSVARSPLYSINGETIAGAPILQAFGASSKFMRDMLHYVDTNINPNYWQWAVNRWLSARFDLLSAVTIGVTGCIAVSTPTISAALAGSVLSFSGGMTFTLLFLNALSEPLVTYLPLPYLLLPSILSQSNFTSQASPKTKSSALLTAAKHGQRTSRSRNALFAG
ncbi:hypothetical protein C8R48DRAFT_674092 [Suillus tomentosus]|nr:hypothetical protein C8R48DRAFT_674092 [Suillus tomentosus]